MDNQEFVVKAFLGSRQTVARLDTQKAELRFIQAEKEDVPLDEPVELGAYVRKYLRSGQIHPDDKRHFGLLDLEHLREKCLQKESGTLFNYRRLEESGIVWYRVVIAVPEDYSPEQPEILIFRRRMSRNEADVQDVLRVIDEKIHKAIKMDKDGNHFRVVKLWESQESIRPRSRLMYYGTEESMEEEAYVHPGDMEEFKAETSYDRLRSHFEAGNKEKSIYYRRKTGSLYRWVKLMIFPASEYTPENPVLLYLIEDVHRSLVGFFSKQGNTAFVKKYKKTNEGISAYYENILNALSFFTQKYLDFCVVDLDRDLYIKYKMDRGVVSGSVPYVGAYSKFISTLIPEEQMDDLQNYTTTARLRKLLANKMSVDFTVTLKTGDQVKVNFTRSEVSNGVPTKVICRVVRKNEENRLKVKTFGSFDVYDGQGKPIRFTKKKSKQLLAYLVDRHGYSVSTADIVTDVLEKPKDDLNAKKYVSTLIKMAVRDLEDAGYADVIVKEWNAAHINVEKLDCDYYHLLDGDSSYWQYYHNEYMKDYSWAEETNAELLRADSLR